MKPHRITIANELIVNYGLYHKMYVYRPHYARSQDMRRFHSEDYISQLQTIQIENFTDDMKRMLKRFQIGTNDCPVFFGMFDFCQIYSGGSIAAAMSLNDGSSDICINWMGGLHHAKKSQASGFCYVNDCVLAILELLKYNKRVLYIDIDIHHGDGVEEAFYTTDRVMTVSFHRYGNNFFPKTGDIDDIGAGKGKKFVILYVHLCHVN